MNFSFLKFINLPNVLSNLLILYLTAPWMCFQISCYIWC